MRKEKESILSRSVSILSLIAKSSRRLNSSELAEELNLPKPNVYRLINQLNEEGLLKRDPFGKGHVPGDKLYQLAMQVLSDDVSNAPRRAILQQLSDEVGETCNMTYLDGRNLIYFDRVETEWPIKVQLPLGSKVPLHCTASGKLFLASMSVRKRQLLVNNLSLKRYTERTITELASLEQAIKKIMDTGVGTDDEEFIRGMVAIAVPVLDRETKIACTIAIHAPTLRKSIDELRQYLPVLRHAAAEVSAIFDQPS